MLQQELDGSHAARRRGDVCRGAPLRVLCAKQGRGGVGGGERGESGDTANGGGGVGCVAFVMGLVIPATRSS